MNSFVLSALMSQVASHVVESTLVALGLASLTLLFRRNSARVRYCLWLAASVKFLLPFALLTALGGLIPWPAGSVQGMELSLLPVARRIAPIVHVGGEGHGMPAAQAAHSAYGSGLLLTTLGMLWLLGAIAVAARTFSRWMRIYREVRESVHTDLVFVTPVRSCASQLEPAVVGIVRPVLLLPAGIEQRLTPEQMSAVLAHERAHVAWRDNLAAGLHLFVEAVFWFYPLIWWLGKRLVDERERACDERVLADGHRPENYAEGILRVCEHYLASRLTCVAGAGGANLRKRIEAIMRNRPIVRLNGMQKVVIAAAAGAAIAMPFAAGVLTSPHAYAQEEASQTQEPNGAIELWRPNFKDTDIRVIAEAVGKATGRNFIVDPRARVHITMVSATALTAPAFYQAFVSTLQTNGFKAEGDGDVVNILPDGNVPATHTDPQSAAWNTEDNGALQLWRPNFMDTDITVVADAVSKATGRKFIIDPGVHAQVTMLAKIPMSSSAFYQAFLGILDVYGLNTEPAGEAIKIVSDANAAPLAHAEAGAAHKEGPNPAAQVRPQFKDADITEVAGAVSLATGKNFIIDPRVRAKVTMPEGERSPQALYEAFLALLKAHGFKAESAGGVIYIVPAADSPPQAHAPSVGSDTGDPNSARPSAPDWDLAAYDVRQLSPAAATLGQITVRASIKNAAGRPQPMPVLRVTLLDGHGNEIATRDMLPADYLPYTRLTGGFMPPGERIDAKMTLADPGANAQSYEVDACLPGPDGRMACASDVPPSGNLTAANGTAAGAAPVPMPAIRGPRRRSLPLGAPAPPSP